MSQPDDDTDKRHEPSQKKLDDARKKGEVPRSNDLSVAASYGGLLLCILTAGMGSTIALGTVLLEPLDSTPELAALVFEGDSRAALAGFAADIGRAVLPWFAIPALAVVGTIVAQRGFTFVPSKLQMKLSRISPVSNTKNKYGRNGLFEFAKSFTKLMIYSACLGLFLNARLPEMASLPKSEPVQAVALLARITVDFLFIAFLVAVAIGGVDFLWQRAEHLRKNRMSDKEMRDEHKDSEGDPHMKQSRRQRAQDIAMTQMAAEVRGADVVLVNPTHFAVALKWSRQRGEAPVCVAKGIDELALRIRSTAEEASVPIRSDPPTARAIHATTEIGQEIAPDHYRAVAAAIRFADAMRKRAKRGNR